MERRLNLVPFVSVGHMVELVRAVGPERFLMELAGVIEADFLRWESFEKTPRLASHTVDGVIELMPTCDGVTYGFKYVNGHPHNFMDGRQTVTAFGMLADVKTGYPVLLSEMTLLTALRTAATSALVAKHLARPQCRTMALIGNGAQSEFQAIAFKAILGVDTVRLFDIDATTSQKCARHLSGLGFGVAVCETVEDAVLGAGIITTVTADKCNATILTDNLVGHGVHINAVGGDCPGKTELHPDILKRADIFVEHAPQTRVEGEIQRLAPDHPVTEVWQMMAGHAPGRTSPRQITVFDSVGFAIEDFSALCYVRSLVGRHGGHSDLDLLASPGDPRDLFGLLARTSN